MRKLSIYFLLFVTVSLIAFGKKHTSFPVTLPQTPNPTITATPQSIEYIPQTPLLPDLFGANHSWTATLAAERLRTIVVTGDVMLGRHVTTQVLKRKNYLWPWEKTSTFLRDSANLTLVNLENPIFPGCPPRDDGMVFCADSRHLEGLQSAGVDVASLANNHIGNWGRKGVEDTLATLQSIGMSPVGTGSAVIREINGLRFAFLAYNDVGGPQPLISSADPATIQKNIIEAKTMADIVIPYFHWGEEYRYQPTSQQVDLAHLAVDAGADLVLGSHPHWFQGVELYHGKYIAYSHGNFIFDQMWSQETREGIVGRYVFFDTVLVDIEFLPTLITDYGQANFLEGEAKNAILTKLLLESQKLCSK